MTYPILQLYRFSFPILQLFCMYAPYCYFWACPHCTPPPPTLANPLLPPISPFHQLYRISHPSLPALAENALQQPQRAVELVKIEERQVKLEEPVKHSKFKYPKKNVQSNVVNQVISFLTSKTKSKHILSKILSCPLKIDAFYIVLREVKRKNRQYIGRSFLQGLIDIEQDHPIHPILFKKNPKGGLRLAQIREAIIKLTNYFLRNMIVPALLTSSKLDKSTLLQHLQRAREILNFVNAHPSRPL